MLNLYPRHLALLPLVVFVGSPAIFAQAGGRDPQSKDRERNDSKKEVTEKRIVGTWKGDFRVVSQEYAVTITGAYSFILSGSNRFYSTFEINNGGRIFVIHENGTYSVQDSGDLLLVYKESDVGRAGTNRNFGIDWLDDKSFISTTTLMPGEPSGTCYKRAE
jgi:hypothetical protein